MALFFDQEWYDARLAERGLTRGVLAAVAGMSAEELELAYKDQRELTAAQIAAFAELLGAPLAETARRAGVGVHAAPPSPAAPAGLVEMSLEQKVAVLEARVAALEAELARLRR
ncbi:MAG: DNA-binding protein [Caulobacter sp.]|nr:DNA-binding protein [Caulobacter sp.]